MLLVTLRSLAWGAAAVALAWALMAALAPRAAALPPAALVGSVLLPSLVPLMILLAWIATSTLTWRVRLSDRGISINRTRRVRWADAQGYRHDDASPGELLVLDRDGRVTRVPLPPEPLRAGVLAFVASRAPPLGEAEVAPHTKPIHLHWSHALGIMLIACLNGLAAGWVSVAVAAAGWPPALALGALGLACTPAGALGSWGFAVQYPRHRFLRVHVFGLVTALAAGYGGVVVGALLASGRPLP